MLDQDTAELYELLKWTSLDEYKEYAGQVSLSEEITFSSYFLKYLSEHQISKKEVVKNSYLDRTYSYQIISGVRKTSKDKVIALCIAAKMTFHEIQRALEISNLGILYPKNSRDAAIITCIHNNIYDVNHINIYLDELGFSALK